MFSSEERSEIVELIAHGHNKRAACVDAMNWVQSRFGWVSDQALGELSALLDMSTAELDSVATFYNLIFRRQVGRHVILVCDSISCWMVGSENVFGHLKTRLGIVPGETTADGLFTLLPVPCLGACHRAPAMMINDDLHVNLTAEKIDEILECYRSERGDG